MSDLEQYTRANCFEIRGIAAQKDENVKDIVISVSNALNHPLSDLQIDNCHRLPTRPDSIGHPAIIVKVTRRIDKEMLLRRRRELRDFSTRNLGRDDNSLIYLNECLSPERRELHTAARRLMKERGYKFVWIRNGRVFARKDERTKVLFIESHEDLEKMK